MKVLEFKSSNTDLYCFNMDYKQVDDGYLSPAFIITLLVSTIQYTSVSHCTLNFEGPCLGYGFLSIILVLEKCIFGSLKVLEKSLHFVLCICCEPCITLLLLLLLVGVIFLKNSRLCRFKSDQDEILHDCSASKHASINWSHLGLVVSCIS